MRKSGEDASQEAAKPGRSLSPGVDLDLVLSKLGSPWRVSSKGWPRLGKVHLLTWEEQTVGYVGAGRQQVLLGEPSRSGVDTG